MTKQEAFFRAVFERLNTKSGEHNNKNITFGSYCPSGLKSAATLLHREALRVCACAESGDVDGMLEHLIDVGVYAVLTHGYTVEQLYQIREKKQLACCYYHEAASAGQVGGLRHTCRTSCTEIDPMWWEMCKGTGSVGWSACLAYRTAKSLEAGE
jgi:hypothetical protein